MHLDRAVFAGDESSAEEGTHSADRKVPMMIITLTKKPTHEDLEAIGHQGPVDPSRLRNRADDFAGGSVPQGRRARSLSFTRQGTQPTNETSSSTTAAPQSGGVVVPATTTVVAPLGGGRRRGRFFRPRGGRIPQPAVQTA